VSPCDFLAVPSVPLALPVALAKDAAAGGRHLAVEASAAPDPPPDPAVGGEVGACEPKGMAFAARVQWTAGARFAANDFARRLGVGC
jgi:hypothetical protein